jgi:glycosyltransferase involved in cell wall biosynthesis
MDRPSILVAVPLYNAAKYISKALDSLFLQTCSDYHILIVDDGSNDGSLEIVNTYVGKNLTVLRQSNSGPGVAMNKAIRFALQHQIPLVARMDADDLSMPQRLEIQMRILNQSPQAVACSSNCYYIDSDDEEIIGTSTVPVRPSLIKWEIRNGLRGLIQGATLFRTDALAEVGGYRPQFLYAEEADLFLRLSEHHECVNAREYLYKIRLNRNSLSLTDPYQNLLYHFYALECSRNRLAGKQEVNFETFLQKRDWLSSLRISQEEAVLKLWRSNLTNKNYFRIFLAALLDPRRAIARLLRKL